MRFKGLITRQAELLLSSKQRALLIAVLLAVLPFCAWIAMIAIALVTLRKGEREGGQLLLAVMIAHTLISAITEPPIISVINTTIFFVPCYLGACILRMSASWQVVAGALLLLVCLTALGVQLCVPQWVVNQYKLLQSLIPTDQSQQLTSQLKWLKDTSRTSELIMANVIFGLQMLSAVISVLVSLVMARSLQSRLYYPKGFADEMLAFRGNRFSCVLFVLLGLGAWQLNVVAVNVMPVFALLYLMAGLSICAKLFMGKTSRFTGVLLLVPLMFVPFVMVPLYIVIGLLDGLFNLRVAFCR